jgi:hypothetical protein
MGSKVTVQIENQASSFNRRGGTFASYELMSVVAFLAAQVFGAIHLISMESDGPLSTMIVLALAVVSSWFLADAVSGGVHFIADNFGDPNTPVVGSRFIAPFREHHVEPESMLNHGALERNANNALIALPVCVWVPFFELEGALGTGLAMCSLGLAWWVCITNEIHAWAHCADPPKVVRVLQSAGVFLPPEQHERHHRRARRSTGGSHYCITSGVCDRILEHLRRLGK